MDASEIDPFGLAGQMLDGKYTVEQPIALGGFGVVYLGRHRALRSPVAIKVLIPRAASQTPPGPDFVAAFEREARTVARLDHPAVVRVLDFGVSPMPVGGETPWMVMEWVEGEPLSEHLAARRGAGGRGPAECLALFRPVLEALAQAHALGIAHRDLKPDNLMLVAAREPPGSLPPDAVRSRRPRLRLLDFGIAKAMEPDAASPSGETLTAATTVNFSLPYAAPEQVTATRTGPWTDVHALGLILTEMLTDARPYRGSGGSETYLEVMSPSRPTPAKLGVDVGAWEPVLQRATALRPGERYADAGALLAALEAAAPSRVTHGARPRRPMRRALAVACLGLLVVAAAAAYGSRSSTSARSAAVVGRTTAAPPPVARGDAPAPGPPTVPPPVVGGAHVVPRTPSAQRDAATEPAPRRRRSRAREHAPTPSPSPVVPGARVPTLPPIE